MKGLKKALIHFLNDKIYGCEVLAREKILKGVSKKNFWKMSPKILYIKLNFYY